MTEFPSFAVFYHAIHGRDPFPWQDRLAGQVAELGWPSEIGVPTGLGKTSCIDIGVWALARQADLPPQDRTAPTRIWYVVNRRLLVDAAWSHGLRLASMLGAGLDMAGHASEVVGRVAEALKLLTRFGSKDGPLQITRLRGGADIGARPLEPSQPAIIFATVPMFASRWLFRGYGTSTSMRPVDAALAGVDALVLLDEAHLARPLLTLSGTVKQCDIGEPSAVVNARRTRPVLVALTATGEWSDDRFDLDDQDHEHPDVKLRINASKSVALYESTEKSLFKKLAECAVKLLDSFDRAASCVVFVNTPKAAREVAGEMHHLSAKRARECDIRMATGRMRDREAERVRELLVDPVVGVPAVRSADAVRQKDLVVIATQTLEVGADLDFDALVTETAGVRSLIQRLGRLNRLGAKDHAPGAVVHPSDRETWPVYGDEPVAVWEALTAAAGGGAVNLAPAQIAQILGPPKDVPPRVGELLHAHLWEWAKTSLPPAGEAPVHLFFEGFGDDVARISVCWRARLPEGGVRLLPGLRQAESIDLPLWELRASLEQAGVEDVHRLADDRATLEPTAVKSLRPGDQVVLPARLGLYDLNGWNPGADEEVLDASVLQARMLPLSSEVLNNLAPGFDPGGVFDRLADPGEEDLSTDEESDLVAKVLDILREVKPHPWMAEEEWQAFIDGFGQGVTRPLDNSPFLSHVEQPRTRAEVRAEAFEELSFDVGSVALAAHLDTVGKTAELIARCIGVHEALIPSVKAAGDLHDLGKRDPRFQRWLDPENDAGVPVAKSAVKPHLIEPRRVAAGWPRGGRHELLSARIVAEWILSGTGEVPWDPDLVLHLISAHHGHGRPLVTVVDDPDPVPVSVVFGGTEVKVICDLSLVDWDQPSRFRSLCERYGYWGLALLEAIVRQADHVASSVTGVA